MFISEYDNLKEYGFEIWGIDIEEIEGNVKSIVAEGENIDLHCGASIHNYTDIHWVKKKSEHSEEEEVIKNSNRKFYLKHQDDIQDIKF